MHKPIVIFFFLFISQVKLHAQSSYTNPVILSHYDSIEIALMQSNDTTKFNTVLYYYTQSFIIDTVVCSDCLPFNVNEFDVSKYEQFREKNTRYIRKYNKQGFQLTLLSMNELLYKLPIHVVKLTQ